MDKKMQELIDVAVDLRLADIQNIKEMMQAADALYALDIPEVKKVNALQAQHNDIICRLSNIEEELETVHRQLVRQALEAVGLPGGGSYGVSDLIRQALNDRRERA